MLAKILHVLGTALVIFAGACVVIGLGMIWYRDGFAALRSILSPFNVVGWLVMAAAFAPGLALLHLRDKLRKSATDSRS